MTRTDHNKRIAVQFIELAAANRFEECSRLLSTEATWWVAGSRSRLRVAGSKDRSRIDKLFASVKQMFPNGLHLQITGVTAEADRVAVEAVGDGVTATHVVYHNCYHFLFEIKDCMIVAVREYMDTLHLSDVLDVGVTASPRDYIAR